MRNAPRSRCRILSRIYFGYFAFVLVLTGRLSGTVYDYTVPDGSGRALRLNIPSELTTVRGIISWGNGGVGDSRGGATRAENVAFAQAHDFCVVGTSGFDFYGQQDAYQVYTTGLVQFGIMSGHPELGQVPWLPLGHSNGGMMTYNLNVFNPGRTISFAVTKAGGLINTRPGAATLATPGLLIAGELDTAIRLAVIRDAFEGNRPRGALWAWAEEGGIGHDNENEEDLIRPFVQEVLNLRYPDNQDPENRTLRAVDETAGWLVEPLSYKDGWARIYSYADYPGNRQTAGWLPSRRIAYIFRAFASYNKATATATLSSGAGPIDWGTTITYILSAPLASWTAIDFYEGDTLLRHTAPTDTDALTLNATASRGGYLVYHAVVTLSDGTQRATYPRRVFLRAQAPATGNISGFANVTTGSTVTLTASVIGYPTPTFQWRKDGVDLTDGGNISGTNSAILTIANFQAANVGLYTLVATNGLGSTVSSPVLLALPGTAPSILTQPANRLIAVGENATYTVAVGGNPLPTTQWQRLPAGTATWLNLAEGGSYSGVITTTLTVSSTTAAMSADQFRCVVTNTAGTTNSNAVTLTVSGISSALFQFPAGLLADNVGNLYVTDASTHLVRKVNQANAVSTIAGSSSSVGIQDGTSTNARFNHPDGLALDATGNLYVADNGNATIRKITPAGVVSTFAGSPDNRGHQDGTGSSAWFTAPSSLALDSAGNLYVADPLDATIRKITPAGVVSTLAGTTATRGDTDGPGHLARFNYPDGIAIDSVGNVLVADTYNSTIRKITPQGQVSTLAGLPGVSGSTDGTILEALFNQPRGIAIDATNNLYVADTGSGTIRRITPAGTVNTFAGLAGIAGLRDAVGINALFNQPRSVTIGTGNVLYVSDSGNGVLRRITADSTVSTLALTEAPTTPTPQTPTTPTTPTTTNSSGSGGGGATGMAYAAALFLAVLMRQATRKR